MLVKFYFDTDSGEETLKNKLREAKDISASIESRLVFIANEKILDKRVNEDRDYF